MSDPLSREQVLDARQRIVTQMPSHLKGLVNDWALTDNALRAQIAELERTILFEEDRYTKQRQEIERLQAEVDLCRKTNAKLLICGAPCEPYKQLQQEITRLRRLITDMDTHDVYLMEEGKP